MCIMYHRRNTAVSDLARVSVKFRLVQPGDFLEFHVLPSSAVGILQGSADFTVESTMSSA